MIGARSRCRYRCWFTVYGHVGLRSPVCRRCGRPNPRPLLPTELAEFEHWRDHRRYEFEDGREQ